MIPDLRNRVNLSNLFNTRMDFVDLHGYSHNISPRLTRDMRWARD